MKNENNINSLLKEWFEFREEQISTFSDEDRKHFNFVEEVSQKILNNVSKKNRKYVEKQIEKLSYSFYGYAGYLNEKYYMSGFKDAILIVTCNLDI